MKSQAKVDEESIQEEVQRLLDVLRTLVRMLGYTNRDIERRANLNHATTVKNFQGKGEPRLEFVLKVAKAIGLEFWELFDFAYAERGNPSDSGRQLRRMLERLHPHPPRVVGRPETPSPPPHGEPAAVQQATVSPRDLEKTLEDLRRDVRELVERQQALAGQEEEAKPPKAGRKREP